MPILSLPGVDFALLGRLGELFINLRDSKGYAVETARLASALCNCPVLDCLPPPMASGLDHQIALLTADSKFTI
jgi:hypothetical protein